MTRARRSSSGRGTTVAAIGAAAVVGVSLLGVGTAYALDLRLYRITSGSMAPTIPIGALILARGVDADELREGDIVTAQRPGSSRTVTPRIVDIRDTGGTAELWLQGDANPAPDPAPYPPVTARRYIATLCT